jgi:hypothetical protein
LTFSHEAVRDWEAKLAQLLCVSDEKARPAAAGISMKPSTTSPDYRSDRIDFV